MPGFCFSKNCNKIARFLVYKTFGDFRYSLNACNEHREQAIELLDSMIIMPKKEIGVTNENLC